MAAPNPLIKKNFNRRIREYAEMRKRQGNRKMIIRQQIQWAKRMPANLVDIDFGKFQHTILVLHLPIDVMGEQFGQFFRRVFRQNCPYFTEPKS